MSEYVEEGDKCRYDCCSGHMVFGEVENCLCHIDPPCYACTSQELECSECGEGES